MVAEMQRCYPSLEFGRAAASHDQVGNVLPLRQRLPWHDLCQKVHHAPGRSMSLPTVGDTASPPAVHLQVAHARRRELVSEIQTC